MYTFWSLWYNGSPSSYLHCCLCRLVTSLMLRLVSVTSGCRWGIVHVLSLRFRVYRSGKNKKNGRNPGWFYVVPVFTTGTTTVMIQKSSTGKKRFLVFSSFYISLCEDQRRNLRTQVSPMVFPKRTVRTHSVPMGFTKRVVRPLRRSPADRRVFTKRTLCPQKRDVK